MISRIRLRRGVKIMGLRMRREEGVHEFMNGVGEFWVWKQAGDGRRIAALS